MTTEIKKKNTETEIPEGWVETVLGEVVDLIIDHRGLTPKKLGGDWSKIGYRAISAKTVKGGRLVNESHMNILPEAIYKKWMKNEVEIGDIFMTSEAPLGEHLIWKTDEKLVLSQRIFGIRTDKDLLNPFYFNYFIDSPYYQHELQSRESGTTVTGIRQSELLKTKVLYPPLPEQKAIADVLSSLDNKIELLREQNITLEKTAQTIFKEWFGKYQVGDVLPEGWRVGKLTDIASFLNGLAMQKFPAKAVGKSLPVIKIKELNQGISNHTDRANLEVPAEYIISNGDMLFSWSGSLEVVIWQFGRGALNQHLFKVSSDRYPKWFYYNWVMHHLKEFRAIAATKATTMGHINRKHLENVVVLIPDYSTLVGMSDIMEPLLSKFEINNREIQLLSKIRDTLLPKLMKGEIRVK